MGQLIVSMCIHEFLYNFLGAGDCLYLQKRLHVYHNISGHTPECKAIYLLNLREASANKKILETLTQRNLNVNATT